MTRLDSFAKYLRGGCTGRLAALGVTSAVAVLAACGSGERAAPGGETSARLLLQTGAAPPGSQATLRAWYQRVDGTRINLATGTRPISGSGTVSIPFTVEVGSCLADPGRSPGAAGCPVRVDVFLFAPNGVRVDSSTVGPFDIRPGATVSAPTGPTLRFVSTVRLTAPTAPLEISDTFRVPLELRDRTGVLLDGRAMRWTTSDSRVATVSAAGTVTARSDGTVRVGAIAQEDTTRRDSVTVTVRAAPITPVNLLVSMGGFHTCASVAGRGFFCTGSNADGQFGIGSTGGINTRFIRVDWPLDDGPFERLTTTYFTSCAVYRLGTMRCAGYNANGEIGANSAGGIRPTPVVVANGPWQAVMTGGIGYNCGLRRPDGAPFCWGGTDSVRFLSGRQTPRTPVNGDGSASLTPRPTPRPVVDAPPMDVIDAGIWHTCGIARGTGDVFCWGDGFFGQLGQGSTTGSLRAVRVPLPRPAVRLAIGGYFSCAILSAPTELRCWGDNSVGQLGILPAGGQILTPQPSSFTDPEDIAASEFALCIVQRVTRQVLCAGNNSFGQLGNGGGPDSGVPRPISNASRFQRVFAGARHVCAVTESAELWCWGENEFGQLGDGATINRATPVRITLP